MDSHVRRKRGSKPARLNGPWLYFLGFLPLLCQLAVFGFPERPHQLAPALLCGVLASAVVALLRREAARANRQLELMRMHSETDVLTGLRNRRGLAASLEAGLRACARQRTPLAVLCFDLDGFKQVNDRLGHAKGDELLQTFAAILKVNCRAGLDEAFRLGGDEFVVVMRASSVLGAQGLAERVRTRLRRHPGLTSLGVHVDASAGAASAFGFERAECLLERADRALLDAKASGKGRTCVAAEARPVAMHRAGPSQSGAVSSRRTAA